MQMIQMPNYKKDTVPSIRSSALSRVDILGAYANRPRQMMNVGGLKSDISVIDKTKIKVFPSKLARADFNSIDIMGKNRRAQVMNVGALNTPRDLSVKPLGNALLSNVDVTGKLNRQGSELMNVGNLNSNLQLTRLPGGMGDVTGMVLTDANGTMWDAYGQVVDGNGSVVYTAQQVVDYNIPVPSIDAWQANGLNVPAWPQPSSVTASAPASAYYTPAPYQPVQQASTGSIANAITSIVGLFTGASNQIAATQNAQQVAAAQAAAKAAQLQANARAPIASSTVIMMGGGLLAAWLLLKK